LLREWDRHPSYDDYWAEEDCTRFFDKMDVPCFTIGSWYDFMCVGSVQSFIGRQHRGGPRSRGSQQLLIGPWLHGRDKEVNEVAEMKYPANARFPMESHMLKWFDHYLKGVDNSVEREPTVRYYTMGALGEADAPGNAWREAADWPIPVAETPYYLHAGGQLSTSAPGGNAEGNEAFTEFLADPDRPNAIPGTAFPGAADARKFEAQDQVRTFTSAPLTQPVEWTGVVRAELKLSSSAPDTDVFVRVCDVYPDGRSILIMDMIRRLRYRDGFDREVFLEPGQVQDVNISVGWLSQVFNRGHRIRITIASTGAPFYEPQPNTADPVSHEAPAQRQTAINRVYHHANQASRVVAPVAD
jgi:putative CocE/NonD family hydrolase